MTGRASGLFPDPTYTGVTLENEAVYRISQSISGDFSINNNNMCLKLCLVCMHSRLCNSVVWYVSSNLTVGRVLHLDMHVSAFASF